MNALILVAEPELRPKRRRLLLFNSIIVIQSLWIFIADFSNTDNRLVAKRTLTVDNAISPEAFRVFAIAAELALRFATSKVYRDRKCKALLEHIYSMLKISQKHVYLLKYLMTELRAFHIIDRLTEIACAELNKMEGEPFDLRKSLVEQWDETSKPWWMIRNIIRVHSVFFDLSTDAFPCKYIGTANCSVTGVIARLCLTVALGPDN